MKYVITGSAGNISKPLSEKLLNAGHQVTVVGRNKENLQALIDKGAIAAVGSIEDSEFLKKTFTGADAVYIMSPPQYAAQSLDVFRQNAARYAEAIASAKVRRVVNLSSVGAHLFEGAGPVSGLYGVEDELNKLNDTHVLHLRPGFFFTNFFGSLGMVKHMNILGANYGDANTVMILSHPNDIAEAAASELNDLSFSDHSVRYLASDERTTGEIAKVLGAAVGKPGLPWVEFTDEQAYEGMKQAGMPEGMVQKYTEMGKAIRTGKLFEDYTKNRPKQFGKTKLEDFAKDFAAALSAA
jgi:uncharacterized protein YbjT (DUF2867 family)